MIECPVCHGAGSFTAQTAFGVSGSCVRCSGLGMINPHCLTLGEHACYFYNNDQQLLETVVSYLFEGLRLKQQCICVPNKLSPQIVLDSLSKHGIKIDVEQKRGALMMLSKEETYLRDGIFDPKGMVEFLKELPDAALKRGFTSSRSVGEMSWTLESFDLCSKLVDYEFMLDNYFMNEKPRATILCLYDLRLFPGALIEEMRLAHRSILQD